MVIDESLERRFWERVRKGPGCWEWVGAKVRDGYGELTLGGSTARVRAHRLSWALHKGAIPNGMLVLHKCDNRSCVRPDHLFLGTQSDNNHDMAQKGRARSPRVKGTANGASKLTEAQVRELRLLREQGWLLRDLAAKYDLSVPQIWHITKRNSWKHVD